MDINHLCIKILLDIKKWVTENSFYDFIKFWLLFDISLIKKNVKYILRVLLRMVKDEFNG